MTLVRGPRSGVQALVNMGYKQVKKWIFGHAFGNRVSTKFREKINVATDVISEITG
jgi:hypothetical protein